MSSPNPSPARAATAAAFAFTAWGVLPIYWKQFDWLGADAVIALRAAMCVPVVLLLLLARAQFRAWGKAWLRPRSLLLHAVTGGLLAVNWLLFVWTTQNGQILESSLGYFLTPLMNVALGALFLRERPNPTQGLALVLAAAGVLTQVAGLGRFPVIALALSVTFALYGLLRKLARLEALQGLALESVLSLPLALWWLARGPGVWPVADARQAGLVLAMGVATVLPLWAFAYGARRLRMITLGMLQFLAPILHFLCGWAVYGEPLQPARLLSFAFIWAGLGVFLFDLWRSARRRPMPPPL